MMPASYKDEMVAIPSGRRDFEEGSDMLSAFQLLGGRNVINEPVSNALEAHDLILKGISSAALQHLVAKVALLSSGDALSKAIGMSLRTLQRKKSY